MKVRRPEPLMPKKGKKGVDPFPLRGESEKATGFSHIELTGRNQNSKQYNPKRGKK